MIAGSLAWGDQHGSSRPDPKISGGIYNPIIPVFKKPPKEWKPDIPERFKGLAIAQGYVRFFEPDVYVEAGAGLLEEAGLGAFLNCCSLPVDAS